MRTTTFAKMRAVYPLFVVLVMATAGGEARAASRAATLEAIHKLENPRNVTRPGRHGELGAYQFRAATWRMHTTLPFQQALDRETSDVVAVRHYEWIKRGLERANLPATPYNIALAWNGGLSAAISGRAPRIAHDYAQRASNLATVIDVDESRLLASMNVEHVPVEAQ